MIGCMVLTIHMTESEVASNFAAVLQKIREGVEVVVEQDHRPVALIRSPRRSGRLISECIASAKASGSKITLDGGFAHDVEEGIRNRQEPWNPPSWE
jgi:antitoxin (DNA-binding transcriptional repressor) of toxin-antitoxin stability system